MKPKPLKIARPLWNSLVAELRRRGAGERESGGFMLATAGERHVRSFICYDDLDDNALDSGIITFHACGFVKLWDYCQKHGLCVVADVHTHPSDWTGQSESDRTHPMVAVKGHLAIILPNFAAPNAQPLNGASVYEYKGNHRWRIPRLTSTLFQITD